MRIVRAEVAAFSVRLVSPLMTGRGEIRARRGFLLRLVADSGLEGLGEASPAYWIGEERLEDVAEVLRGVVELVASRPAAASLCAAVDGRARVDAAGCTAERHAPLCERSPAAACAVDTALLDLEARARGMALATLLGGDADAALPVCALVIGRTSEALADAAVSAVGEGYRVLKVKVGAGSVAEDVRRIEAVRRRIGEGIPLRLDANRAWTPAQARQALSALAASGIELVEEPLRGGEPRMLAALRASSPVRVAVDESVRDAASLRRVVEAGAASVVVLKTARVGGPSTALRLAEEAGAAGLEVVITDSIETAIGMSVAAHVAAALPPPRLALGLGGVRLIAGSIVDAECPLRAPCVRARGPGLGVTARSMEKLDWNA
jgi:o-succinylbenzoate synthase